MTQSTKTFFDAFNPFAGLPPLSLGEGFPMAKVPDGAMMVSNDFLAIVADRQSSLPAMELFSWADRKGLLFISTAIIKERTWGFAKGIKEGSAVAAEKAGLFHSFLAGFDPARIVKEDTGEMTHLLATGFNLPGIADLYRSACRKGSPRLRTDIVVALQAYAYDMPVISGSKRFEHLRSIIPFPGVLAPKMPAPRR